MLDSTGPRDIEETEDLLEAAEPDSVQFWERKQREVILSVVDYNLNALEERGFIRRNRHISRGVELIGFSNVQPAIQRTGNIMLHHG